MFCVTILSPSCYSPRTSLPFDTLLLVQVQDRQILPASMATVRIPPLLPPPPVGPHSTPVLSPGAGYSAYNGHPVLGLWILASMPTRGGPLGLAYLLVLGGTVGCLLVLSGTLCRRLILNGLPRTLACPLVILHGLPIVLVCAPNPGLLLVVLCGQHPIALGCWTLSRCQRSAMPRITIRLTRMWSPVPCHQCRGGPLDSPPGRKERLYLM